MTRHEKQRPSTGIRATIASAAARLMAEDGITDYHHAKKKAARQLGLPENTAFPDNGEVEAELRVDFNPYLTDSVLDGTAGVHSHIDILLFADSAKEVEIFLLNRGINIAHVEARNERVEAVLQMETDTADANLVVCPPQMERVSLKYHDGRPQDRIRAEGLRALLKE